MSAKAFRLALLILVSSSVSACTSRLVNVPGEKTGHSNKTDVDVIVETSNIKEYRWRLVPEDATNADCSVPDDYSSWLPLGTHLIKDISSMADGPVKICLESRTEVLINGNPSNGISHTQATWVKDTVPPAPFSITGPAGTQTTSSPTITWTASDGASSYEVQITSDAACENVYKTYSNITETTFQVPGIANGFWHVCIKSSDLAENQTPAVNNGILMTVDAPFHYLFTTSSVYTGNELSGTDNMDDICTLHAFIGNLIPDWNGVDRVYRALVSTSSVDAKDRVVLDRSIFNRNNDLVVFGSDIWNGVLLNPFVYDENGSLLGAAPVWTGSTSDGLASSADCNDWTSNSGTGTAGDASKKDSYWSTGDTARSCDSPAHLYCVGPY